MNENNQRVEELKEIFMENPKGFFNQVVNLEYLLGKYEERIEIIEKMNAIDTTVDENGDPWWLRDDRSSWVTDIYKNDTVS